LEPTGDLFAYDTDRKGRPHDFSCWQTPCNLTSNQALLVASSNATSFLVARQIMSPPRPATPPDRPFCSAPWLFFGYQTTLFTTGNFFFLPWPNTLIMQKWPFPFIIMALVVGPLWSKVGPCKVGYHPSQYYSGQSGLNFRVFIENQIFSI